MTFGLPVVCGKQVSILLKMFLYNSNIGVADQILKLKNKSIVEYFFKKILQICKKFKWENISKRYLNLLSS